MSDPHLSIVSIYDLFAVGLGFDFTGAILLAKGLLIRPAELMYRMVQSRNTFAKDNVRAAED